MLGMKNHFDISGGIEIREVEIAGVACNLQHIITSFLIFCFDLDQKADVGCRPVPLKQVHRKIDTEKLERRGNKPSTISQSDDHISMLLRVNKKTDRYLECVEK